MTRSHDMGGRFGDGPIPRGDDESKIFESNWHARALALTLAVGALGKWNIDASRHSRERLPPKDYARFGYYEKWIGALANLMVEHGIISTDEITTGRMIEPGDPMLVDRALLATRVEAVLRGGGPSKRNTDDAPAFALGQRVTTREMAENTTVNGGHTRLPSYAAGRTGTIIMQHGAHVFPDSNAHFNGEAAEQLYTVSFRATDLWQHPEAGSNPKSTSPQDEVCLDLWQSYLTPAP